MNKNNIQERVIKIVSLQLGVHVWDIQPQYSLTRSLGADSLDMAELLMTIEEEFDIELQDDEVLGIDTIEQIVNHITGLE